jgi:hypothetical protein
MAQIQEAVGLDEKFIARELGLTTSKFIFHKHNKLSVPFNGVKSLSKKMGISLNSLLVSELNPSLLKEAIKINWNSRIPKKYQIGDGSRSFTIRHILSVAKHYGVQQEILSHFSLDEISFENKIDFSISVQLASDMLQDLSTRVNLTEQDYTHMSLANAMYFKDSVFGKELSESRSLSDMYERFLQVVNHVEENWEYEMQFADKHKIVINSFSTNKQTECFKRRDYSSYTFTKFRASMGAHLTRYLGWDGARTKITKSVHNGDGHCQFEIDISNLRPLTA